MGIQKRLRHLYKGHIVTYQDTVLQHVVTLGVVSLSKNSHTQGHNGGKSGGLVIFKRFQLRQLKNECYLECQLGKGILGIG